MQILFTFLCIFIHFGVLFGGVFQGCFGVFGGGVRWGCSVGCSGCSVFGGGCSIFAEV